MTTLSTSYQLLKEQNFTLPTGHTAILRTYGKYSSQNQTNNQTTVQLQVKFKNVYPWYGDKAIYGYVGQSSSDYTSGSKKFTSSSMAGTNTEYTLATYEKTITHDDNGEKTINVWGKITQSNWGVNTSASVTATLPKINRKPVWTTAPSITNLEETTVTIDFGTTNITSTFACTDSGGATGTISGNTITFTGLAANSSHTFTITATSTASGLSSTYTLNATTYNWPSIVSLGTSALTPGNSQTLTLNNPLGRSLSVVARCASSSGTSLHSGTTTNTTSYTFTPTNSTSGLFNTTDGLGTTETSINVYYAIDYSGQISSVTGTAVTSEAAYKPVWGNVTAAQAILYKDTNSTAVGISGSDQILVGSKSTLQATGSLSYAATAKQSIIDIYEMAASYSNTTPSSWTTITRGTYVTISGVGTVSNTQSNVYIFLRAKDARGYYTDPLVKTVAITKYAVPSGSISARRKNNYGPIAQVLINPSWSVSSTGNKGTAKVEYKLSTASEGDWDTAVETATTFGSYFDIGSGYSDNATYNIRVTLTDKFEGTSSYLTASFGPSVPLFFIDDTTGGVGVGCFPTSETIYIKEKEVPCFVQNSVAQNGTRNITLKDAQGNNLVLDKSSGIIDLIYPIGSIYMSVNSTSPATLFGGTWVQIQDTFLLASGSTYSAGGTGGSATHTLTTAEMPAHTHGSKTLTGQFQARIMGDSAGTNILDVYPSGLSSGIITYGYKQGDQWQSAITHTTNSSSSKNSLMTIDASHEHDSIGGGQAFDTMPPYLAVYVWKRTA